MNQCACVYACLSVVVYVCLYVRLYNITTWIDVCVRICVCVFHTVSAALFILHTNSARRIENTIGFPAILICEAEWCHP